MLPRKNRVTKAFFEEILGKSLCVHTPLFSFRFQKLKPDKENRFTVVVSKKVANTAVKRNLLKRRFRAVLQDLIKNNLRNRKSGTAGIFFLKKEVSETKFSLVKEEIRHVIMETL